MAESISHLVHHNGPVTQLQLAITDGVKLGRLCSGARSRTVSLARGNADGVREKLDVRLDHRSFGTLVNFLR